MKKTVLTAAALVFAALVFVGCKALIKPQPESSAAPTEPPATADPNAVSETSSHEAFAAASGAALKGEKVDEGLAGKGRQAHLFFAEKNGALMAYSEAVQHKEQGQVRYELRTPAGRLPIAVANAARETIGEKRSRYGAPAADGGELRLFGYLSDRSALLMEEPSRGTAAAALFRRTDDGWTEIPLPEGMTKQLSGGCMATDKVGFICLADRAAYSEPGYDPHEVVVMRTGNGGKSWKKLDIRLPEDADQPAAPPTCALTPHFDGRHGVMIVCFDTYDQTKAKYVPRIAVFESFDRGKTWELRDDA